MLSQEVAEELILRAKQAALTLSEIAKISSIKPHDYGFIIDLILAIKKADFQMNESRSIKCTMN